MVCLQVFFLLYRPQSCCWRSQQPRNTNREKQKSPRKTLLFLAKGPKIRSSKKKSFQTNATEKTGARPMAAKSEWGAWTCTLTIVKYLIIQPQNLQTSIIRTTRRNGKRGLFVTTAYYSNWNPCTADFIQQEALFNSGENEVLSIEDFPERNIVYCHTSHSYLSSTPLAFLGGVLRRQTDGNISPMDAGVGGLWMRSSMEVSCARCLLQISLLWSMRL